MMAARADVIAVLDRAADRLSKRGAWTRDAYACDRYGEVVDEHDPTAVCWCLAGAVSVESASSHGYGLAWDALGQSLAEASADPSDYNDQSRDKRRVIRLLRRTADRLRQEG